MGLRASVDRRVGLAVAAAGIVALSLAALLVSLACGCSLIPGLGGPSALSASETRDEYFAEIESLEERGFVLAPGSEWSQDPPFPASDDDGVGISYGKGYGASWADSYWFYSWASLAVSTSDDAIREDAIQQLARVRETVYYASWAPEDRPHFDQELEEAAQGDMTKLRQDVAVNAPSE